MLDWLFGTHTDYVPDGVDSDDWSPDGWQQIPEQTIALAGLAPGQNWLNEDFVHDLETNPGIRPYGGDRPTWVVNHHGRLVINDGHHRVAAAHARGEHTIRARIRRWRQP